jgi:hypothetical protein
MAFSQKFDVPNPDELMASIRHPPPFPISFQLKPFPPSAFRISDFRRRLPAA